MESRLNRDADTKYPAATEPTQESQEWVGQVAGATLSGGDSYPVWRQRQIVEQFSYHSPTPSQAAKLNLIREAGKMLALTILANTPVGQEQDNAIAQVRAGVMFANASIVSNASIVK